MKKLLQEIEKLYNEDGCDSFRVSFIVDNRYYVYVACGESAITSYILSEIHPDQIANPSIYVKIIDDLTNQGKTMFEGVSAFFADRPVNKSKQVRPIAQDTKITTELRNEILKVVKKTLSIHLNEEKLTAKSNIFTGLEQDTVKKYYIGTFMLNEQQFGQLHRFFSPTRVPMGLTKEEVNACIFMCEMRIQYSQNTSFIIPKWLGHGLTKRIDESISRTEGLQKAFYEIVVGLSNQSFHSEN